MHCFLPVAEGWAGEPRSASSRRVSSSSELDLPSGDHCEAGLLQLDVPLLRAQLRGSRLLDAMRMYRQGGASFPLGSCFSFLEPAPAPPHPPDGTQGARGVLLPPPGPRSLLCSGACSVGVSPAQSVPFSSPSTWLTDPFFLLSLLYSSPPHPLPSCPTCPVNSSLFPPSLRCPQQSRKPL